MPKFNAKDKCARTAPTVIANPHYSGVKKGTIFSLILASLRGNFSTRLASQYEKLKPLKDGPLLYKPEIMQRRAAETAPIPCLHFFGIVKIDNIEAINLLEQGAGLDEERP